MKKAVSLVLTVVMLFACCSVAFAGDITKKTNDFLQFDQNGDFKILHLTDVQDGYPMSAETLQFINETLDTYQPDLVVLGGDNTVAPAADKQNAIKELVTPFVEREICFTLVFGNHDHEQDVDDATLLTYYRQFGGRYCLAYDAVPSLSGDANHNLLVYSSNSDITSGFIKPAYNLWLLDSNAYETDEQGHDGYSCVQPDQIQWLNSTNSIITSLNGGKVVPSMAFQHIIVGEIMDVLYPETSLTTAGITKFCNGKNYLVATPALNKIKGQLFEVPCPGVANYGELDALSENGVVACFSGHDHTNAFSVNINGVDVVNTPGCTFGSYGKLFNRGARLITIHENSKQYESECILMTQSALAKGSEIANVGNNLNVFTCVLGVVLNRIINFFLGIMQ